MPAPESEPTAQRAEWEVLALRSEIVALREAEAIRAVADGYARLWGPIAVVALVLIAMPISDAMPTFLVDGTVAALGMILGSCLVMLSVVATVRPRSTSIPLAVSIISVPIAVILLTLPGSGTGEPALSPTGTAGLVLTIVAGVLGIVHAVHLHLHTNDKDDR